MLIAIPEKLRINKAALYSSKVSKVQTIVNSQSQSNLRFLCGQHAHKGIISCYNS